MANDESLGPAGPNRTGYATQETSNDAPQLDDSGDSSLSEAPATESEPKEPDVAQAGVSANTTTTDSTSSSAWQAPAHSMQTEDLVKRINADAEAARVSGTPPWEAAKGQVMSSMSTSQQFATSTPVRGRGRGAPRGRPRGSGRGAKRTSLVGNGDGQGAGGLDSSIVSLGVDNATPGSTGGRGRGRGRGGGRPRGRGRGAGRGGKRKRDDDDEGGESDSSDEVTPIATMTKSGRSIQKPTSFVPPPPSPPTNKRKRPYNRRNPESAVCKVCLRGVSPASNMIVFCDGCNTPYHRWCHKPPIDQAVIDQSDKEWYCMNCEEERAVPVPPADVSNFVDAGDASEEQRRRYFASLPQGMLVTLLVKATTLHPDLPLFDPQYKTSLTNGEGLGAPPMTNGAAGPFAKVPQQPLTNGASSSSIMPSVPPSQPVPRTHTAIGANQMYNQRSAFHNLPAPDDAAYTDAVHPRNYPRPGQGLMKTLPPETEDLEWLVDDDDNSGVFTHLYQEPAGMGSAPAGASAATNGTQ